MSDEIEEKWDGTPRRKNDIYLKTIEEKVDNVYNFLKTQFGSVDLAGNKMEGETSKSIRQLSEKVAIQNGRVGKLEEFRDRISGALILVGSLVGITGVIVGIISIHSK